MADQQDTGKETKPAGGRDRQRHTRTLTRIGALMPEADQQERQQACQFPEEDELDQIAGNNDAQHRAHEGEEKRKEPRYRVRRRHVVAGIHDDQQPDARDQHGEQPGEPIQTDNKIETGRGKPRQLRAEDTAPHHRRPQHAQQYDFGNRDAAREPRFGIAVVGTDQRGKGATGKRKCNKKDEQHLIRSRSSN